MDEWCLIGTSLCLAQQVWVQAIGTLAGLVGVVAVLLYRWRRQRRRKPTA